MEFVPHSCCMMSFLAGPWQGLTMEPSSCGAITMASALEIWIKVSSQRK